MRGGRNGSKSNGRSAANVILLIAALAAPGCGDDEGPGQATRRDAGSEKDAGPDGQVEPGDRDASQGTKDGAAEDEDGGGAAKGGTGGKGSSGSSGKGGSGGSTPTTPDPDRCKVSEGDNSWSATAALSTASQYSLTTGTTGFGVAFYDVMGCANINLMPVQASGDFSTPQPKLGDDCSSILDVSLLHVATGWRMVWVDNSAGRAELQTMALSEDMSMAVGEMRTRLTDNQLFEQRPVLASLGGAPFVAFIAGDDATTKLRISTRGMDAQASVNDVLPESAERKPVNLAFRQIGNMNAVVAWTDEIGTDTRGVWVQRTDLTATKIGDPVLVSDIAGAGATVDLAARDAENEGGAIVYSVGVGDTQEVRFRRLSATGEVLADEVKIVSGALQGRDASMARLGGGYVIAYRALPGGLITEGELRITFVSKEGTLMRDAGGTLISYKIGSAGAGGGRTTLRVSNDGQLLVGLVDSNGASTQVRLVRKRLDCTL
jgi:hypothetical protein